MKEYLNYDAFDAAIDAGLPESVSPIQNYKRSTPGRLKLRQWLNKYLKIEMTDGRILVGVFLCTDQARNVILGNCSEYLRTEDIANDVEPRLLGLAMVPGHHIVTIHVDNFQVT